MDVNTPLETYRRPIIIETIRRSVSADGIRIYVALNFLDFDMSFGLSLLRMYAARHRLAPTHKTSG